MNSKFHEIAQEIATVLEKKDHDYGSKNMTEFGVLGGVVRISDKTERLKNLVKKEAKVSEETLEDTLLDLAGYAILMLKLRREGLI